MSAATVFTKGLQMTRFAIATFVLLSLTSVPAILRAEERVVTQKGKTFAPGTLTIKPGDKVVFKNDDEITHNVFTVSKGMEFNVKAQAPGESTEHVFATEGVAEVRCAFHPRMQLTIVVKK
jgi:plastocyanin